VLMGPKSKVPESMPEAIQEIEIDVEEDKKKTEQHLNLEAQGILIYDRESGNTSHVGLPRASIAVEGVLTVTRPCG
jgi:hypothetical protein